MRARLGLEECGRVLRRAVTATDRFESVRGKLDKLRSMHERRRKARKERRRRVKLLAVRCFPERRRERQLMQERRSESTEVSRALRVERSRRPLFIFSDVYFSPTTPDCSLPPERRMYEMVYIALSLDDCNRVTGEGEERGETGKKAGTTSAVRDKGQ